VTGLVAAEIRRYTSTRTTWIVTGVGLVLVAFSAGLYVLESTFSGPFLGGDAQVAAAIDQVGGNSVIVLVIGLLAMTTEFRHGTIGRVLQITPSRTRVIVSKLVVGALYGVLFSVLGAVVVALFVVPKALVDDLTLEFGEATVTALWQGPVALALTAILGVALGALLRNQVVAITVSLVWVFILETLAVQFLPSFGRWLPIQALQSVFLSEEVLAQIPEGMVHPLDPPLALGLFLGYVLVASTVAVALLRTRDV
jgi:ABC-type transport system involved in multi-copper enzyme maturation permease subunit